VSDASEQPLSKPGTDVVSGIHTDVLLEADPPCFWVTWIDWSSDFRRELRINDQIVGVNGKSLEPILQPQKTYKGVGQHAEQQYWAEIGAGIGDEISLSILRDDQPLTVKGRLGSDMFYYDHDGKPALAPGGPARLGSEKFGEAWSGWHEKLQNRMSYVLTRGWTQRLSTRTELADMLAHQPRIEHLRATYPNAFTQTLYDDWARVVEVLRGKKADPPVDLEYRAIGERRLQLAKAEAGKAWSALLQETAAERIPAYPAASPLARESAVGKIVELPAITPRNMLNDLGTFFAAVGSPSDGYWFLLLARPEFRPFYDALHRYQGQVNPRIPERYRYLGRVLDDAQMFTVNGRSTMGLAVEPLAVFAGDDELCVDLRRSPPQFAGEAELSVFSATPCDDGSPASVIEAMVAALKLGDEDTWRSLFAPWRVASGSGGRTIIDIAYAMHPGLYASDWERSRRLIMGEVHDARVERVERARRILSRDVDNGLPDVDQVVVWLDHFGLFDGEHRAYQNVNVHRRWVLQRLDDGPWRIVSIQSI